MCANAPIRNLSVSEPASEPASAMVSTKSPQPKHNSMWSYFVIKTLAFVKWFGHAKFLITQHNRSHTHAYTHTHTHTQSHNNNNSTHTARATHEHNWNFIACRSPNRLHFDSIASLKGLLFLFYLFYRLTSSSSKPSPGGWAIARTANRMGVWNVCWLWWCIVVVVFQFR